MPDEPGHDRMLKWDFITLLLVTYFGGTTATFFFAAPVSIPVWLLWFTAFAVFMFAPVLVARVLRKQNDELSYEELRRRMKRRRLAIRLTIFVDLLLYLILTVLSIVYQPVWLIDPQLKWAVFILAPGIALMNYIAWIY